MAETSGMAESGRHLKLSEPVMILHSFHFKYSFFFKFCFQRKVIVAWKMVSIIRANNCLLTLSWSGDEIFVKGKIES